MTKKTMGGLPGTPEDPLQKPKGEESTVIFGSDSGLEDGPQPAPWRPFQPEGTRKPGPPPIEVEYVLEPEGATTASQTWPMLEIWTRNRVYHINEKLICDRVVSRETGRSDEGHSFLGARLTGGERRSKTGNAVELIVPLPVPGTDAVFRKEGHRHGHYGRTSSIERMVLRVRKIRVGQAETDPTWNEYTGRFHLV